MLWYLNFVKMFECPTCKNKFETKRGMKIHHTRIHGERVDESEYEYICPSCDKDFKTENGLYQHHSKVHGERIGRNTVSCDLCGKRTEKRPHRVDEQDNTFCSKECLADYQRSEILDKVCPNCNNGFKTPEYVDQTYCSKECFGGTKTISCEYCGDDYTIARSKNSSFCSRECQSKWQSENWVGENAPRWMGGYKNYYGEDWIKSREKIRERDGNICQVCEETSENWMPVHHIIPVREFDDPNEAHFEENMVQVCRSCHMTVESMSTEKQKRLFGL